MQIDNESLVLDMIEWIDARPRGYAEVIEAWRTSCPRLTIWEDAVDNGLLRRHVSRIEVTAAGRAGLAAAGRRSPA